MMFSIILFWHRTWFLHFEELISFTSVSEQSTEKNIWFDERQSNGRMEELI